MKDFQRFRFLKYISAKEFLGVLYSLGIRRR